MDIISSNLGVHREMIKLMHYVLDNRVLFLYKLIRKSYSINFNVTAKYRSFSCLYLINFEILVFHSKCIFKSLFSFQKYAYFTMLYLFQLFTALTSVVMDGSDITNPAIFLVKRQ